MPDKALVSPLACRVSTYRWMNPGRFDPLAPPHNNTEKNPVGSDSESQ